MIGDITCAYLEEAGEDIATVPDPVDHLHTVTVTIERTLSNKNESSTPATTSPRGKAEQYVWSFKRC